MSLAIEGHTADRIAVAIQMLLFLAKISPHESRSRVCWQHLFAYVEGQESLSPAKFAEQKTKLLKPVQDELNDKDVWAEENEDLMMKLIAQLYECHDFTANRLDLIRLASTSSGLNYLRIKNARTVEMAMVAGMADYVTELIAPKAIEAGYRTLA